MPSYALNPFLDEAFFDDVLCQKFLSLDLRDPPESLLSVLPIGYRTVESPSSLSLGANSSTVESGDTAAMACGYWGQHMEQPCPPRSRWKKISFCSERSVSVVEAGMSGHRWPSVAGESSSNGHCPQPAATSSAQNSLLSSSSSSRYKTELCRTFAESGACKYGGKCQFAHGVEELRDLSRHPKYKTEPCRTFHTIGYCPYGIRCHFVHNNEDDLGSARSLPPAQARATRRPPLLRQSISFAGFPSAPLLPELLRVNPFLCTPTVSPPVSADFPEPLSQASPFSAFFDPASEPGTHQFQASHDLGSSSCCSGSVHSKGDGCWRRRQQQNVLEGFGLRSRSLSYTSLSDHEGGSGSSACSLSGSESSVFEGAGRRLPIFSQLSVPDDSAGFLT